MNGVSVIFVLTDFAQAFLGFDVFNCALEVVSCPASFEVRWLITLVVVIL